MLPVTRQVLPDGALARWANVASLAVLPVVGSEHRPCSDYFRINDANGHLRTDNPEGRNEMILDRRDLKVNLARLFRVCLLFSALVAASSCGATSSAEGLAPVANGASTCASGR